MLSFHLIRLFYQPVWLMSLYVGDSHQDRLNETRNPTFRIIFIYMPFASSTCETLFPEWIGSKPNLILAGEQLGKVRRFSY